MTTDKGKIDMDIEIRKVEKEELLGNLYQAYKEFANKRLCRHVPRGISID